MIFFATFALLLIQAVRSAQNGYFEIGPRHGGGGGGESEIVCPFGGVFTGINYKSSTAYILQLEFICTSSQGKHTFGPYGGNTGYPGSLSCPPGEYISSFYGKSSWQLENLGIRCRPQNDMKSIGKDIGSFGVNAGVYFDESAVSQGYRIMSIKVRTGTNVDAIQATYGNIKIPADLCTTCTNYVEEWAPVRGGVGGSSPYVISTVYCPADGIITGIKYRYGYRLDSITLVCTLAIGISELGPFGGSGGAAGEEKCPPGSYITSIYGRYGSEIDQLGIQCRRAEDGAISPKRDSHGGEGGAFFDDLSYATMQKRPVQFRIGFADKVNTIQVKYGNMPLSMNCKVTNIVVTDNTIIAKSDGYAVIGLATGSTCSSQTQNLQISQAATVEETIGVDTTEGGEVNWSTTVSIDFTYGVEVSAGVASTSTQVSVGLSQSVGGSKSWSTTRSKSTSSSSTSTVGTQVNYQGPGACVVIGTMRRYKVDRDNLPVLYHFKCEGGVKSAQQGTVKLLSTTFDQANFVDFAHTFKSAADCSTKARQCVSSIQAGKTISDPFNLKTDFEKCFQ